MSKHNRDRRIARIKAKVEAGILPFAPGMPNSKAALRDAANATLPAPVYFDDNDPRAKPNRTRRPKLDGTARAIQGKRRFPEVCRGRG